MENVKEIVLLLLTGFCVITNVYTIIDGFLTGKIKSYSHRMNFRLLGEKPIREFSIEFDPTYFWIEVAFNIPLPVICLVLIYFNFFK